MPNGSRTTIRSHRRRGTRRRRIIAPWVVGIVLATVALSGLSAGYLYLVRQSCAGEVRATIAAAPGVATLIEGAARAWQEDEPSVDNRCAFVDVDSKDPALIAQQLGTEWDPKSGAPPDVWVPDSSAWVRRAASSQEAATALPERRPSVATSPTVIAMPKPMAVALGWPKVKLSWQDIVDRLATGAGWGALGKPEWGEFRLGMTDPLRSTAGLHALMAVLDTNDNGDVSAEEQSGVARLRQVQKVYEDSTDRLLANLRREDAQGSEAALRYVSAFPAFEQEVLTYNTGNPRVPLVAIYPSNGTADADYPYLVLGAAWADPVRQRVARAFLAYLGTTDGRRELLAAGFRDPRRTGGRVLAEANGAAARLPFLPRALPVPEVVKRTIELWTAVTRAANVLLVLDVSGSMGQQVPGAGKTRLAVLREAARGTVSALTDEAHVGLWLYASRLDGTRDYRQAVPLGRLADPAGGAATRRAALLGALDRMTAGGNTGLYDTAVAAQKAVSDSFVDGAANLVVLVTDGRNDDDTGGMSLSQACGALRKSAETPRRVPVITVGFGPEADTAALQEISRSTGAVSYPDSGAFELESVLLTAVLGRV
jgi:Ca-activated chloride channel family protein